MSVDIRPRRVWTGLTVPGKKMVSPITQTGGSYRGQLLIDLYKEPPERPNKAFDTALHSETPQFVSPPPQLVMGRSSRTFGTF